MRHDIADSIPLDDLQEGRWYRILMPLVAEDGYGQVDAQFLGIDGHYAFLREEGSLRAEPWPTTMLAQSLISRMPAPFEMIEPLDAAEKRMDAEEVEQLPLTAREKRFVGLCICGVGLFWVVVCLALFWR